MIFRKSNMSENAVISVLITAYNIDDYIGQTLQSVLLQESLYPFEILVGDDGSDDRTVDIINSYIKDNPGRIKLFQMPREKGVEYNRVERSSANRLNLLKNATGRYCSFLDGDDIYTDKKRLEKMADKLEAMKNRDCIACAHNLDMLYEDGRRKPLCSARRERKISLKDYWTQMFLQSDAFMFRNIYREHEPKGRLKSLFDDNNITFWFLRYGKIYYLPEAMAAYRQVGGSSWNAIDDLKRAASNMIGYSMERELAPELKKYSDARHYKDLKYLAKHKKDLKRENLEPFYTTAEKLKLQYALEAYSMNGHWIEKSLKSGKRGIRKAAMRRRIRKLFGRY